MSAGEGEGAGLLGLVRDLAGTRDGASCARDSVKAPSCLKVRLARLVLRRVSGREVFGEYQRLLEGNDLEVTKGSEAIKTFGLETKSSLGLDDCRREVLYT